MGQNRGAQTNKSRISPASLAPLLGHWSKQPSPPRGPNRATFTAKEGNVHRGESNLKGGLIDPNHSAVGEVQQFPVSQVSNRSRMR